MRVLVCGDRYWRSRRIIRERLEKLPVGTEIIHGACRGADLLGAKVAESLGLGVEPYSADWDRYGHAAGRIRNKQMLREGKPDLVLAFHADIVYSKGTKHMVSIAQVAGVPVEIITGM